MQINGWIEEIRDIGKLKFLILHTPKGKYQITIHKEKVSKDIFEKSEKITRQSCISVDGKLKKKTKANVGKEIIPDKIEILGLAETPLPLDPSGKVHAELDTRLDWRSLDLRNSENMAIFKIQSKLVEGMEEYLKKNGFIQIFTPCIMGAASESGAEVFSIVYFDKKAFLRQDPQLHRELTIIGGLDKIYEMGPSWRAEKSHTTRHICEYRGCAVELSFIKDEKDIMKVQEKLTVSVLKKIKNECKEELKILNKKVEVPKIPFPELQFPEIYNILKKMGKKIPVGEDYDRESETLLWRYVKKKFKTDFFFVNRFPSKVKPFYVMKVDEKPKWARSVDLICKGTELSSGGQREHRYNKLIEQIKEKEMKQKNLEWFTKFFKYGAPPMGGFCIGIERLLMKILDIQNIREAVLFPRTPERSMP